MDMKVDGGYPHREIDDPFHYCALTPRLTELLKHAKFIRETSPAQPSRDPPCNACYELTNIGFHYILLDTPTQVHIMLRKFVEFVQASYPQYPEIAVNFLKLIFNMASADCE